MANTFSLTWTADPAFDTLDSQLVESAAGEDLGFAFALDTGSVNVSAWVIQFDVAPSSGRNPILTVANASITKGITGAISFSVPKASTQDFPTRSYYWELIRTDAGNRKILAFGTWNLEGSPSLYPGVVIPNNIIPLRKGGTGSDLSDTGPGVIIQATTGADLTSFPADLANTTHYLRKDLTWGLPSGSVPGTVTTVSVVTAAGVSGSVSNPTTTPAITITLGAITPASVAAVGTVTGSNLSGVNTGDQTNISGNAATVSVIDASSDPTTWPLLGLSQSGNLSPATDASLTYNALTGELSSTTVSATTFSADTNVNIGVDGFIDFGSGNVTLTHSPNKLSMVGGTFVLSLGFLTDSLSAYFKMDETSGNALDSVGSSDLTDNYQVSYGPGKIDNARYLNSGDKYFRKATPVGLNNQNVSWSFWLKFISYVPNFYSSFYSPGSYISNGNWNDGYGWYLDPATGILYWFIQDSDDHCASSPLTLNTWYHCVGTYDATANLVKLYVNGSLVDTKSLDVTLTFTNAGFELGHIYEPWTTPDCLIDECGLWSRAITLTEVGQLYNSGAALARSSFSGGLATGLVSYYKLDEASGNAIDNEGLNNLEDMHSSVGTAAGKINTCRQFDSGTQATTAHYLYHANTGPFDIVDEDFTIVIWFKMKVISTFNAIFSKTDSSGLTSEFDLYYAGASENIYGTPNRLRFSVFKETIIAEVGPLDVDTWYLAIAWHDSVNNTVNLQVNNGTVVSTPTGGNFNLNSDDVSLGAWSDGLGNLDGWVDEVALYKGRVLTADERAAFWNDGDAITYPFIDHALDVDSANGSGGDLAHITKEGGAFFSDTVSVNDLDISSAIASRVFDGTNSFSHADNASLSTGDIDFTFSVWFKATTLTDYNAVFTKTDFSEVTLEYELVLITDMSGTTAVFAGGVTGNISSVPILADVWYFAVCWYDATANTWNIQIDNGTIDSVSGPGPSDTTHAFTVGAFEGGTDGPFVGNIRKLRFWKRVLTAPERTALYEDDTVSSTNLISNWELDELSGDAIDSFGSNDLTDNGSVGASGGSTIGPNVGLTGVPKAPTAAIATNTTQVATCAFVLANSGGGVPTTITVTDEGSDTTNYVCFFNGATGDLAPKTNAFFRYDAANGNLTIPTNYQIGGVNAIGTGGGFTSLYRPAGGVGIYVGTSNYYDADGHHFRLVDTTEVVTIATTGLVSVIAKASRSNALLNFQTSAAASLGNVSGGCVVDVIADVSSTSTDGTFNTLHSYTSPANALIVNGDKIYFDYTCTVVTHTTNTANFKLAFAGITIFDSTAQTYAATGTIRIYGYIIRATSTTARAHISFRPSGSATLLGFSSENYVPEATLTGLTLTGTNILLLTAAAAGTGAASGDIKLTQATIHIDGFGS